MVVKDILRAIKIFLKSHFLCVTISRIVSKVFQEFSENSGIE